MIQDSAKRKQVQDHWDAVRNWQGTVQRGLMSGFARGGPTIFMAGVAHNLPMVFAVAVLEEALEALRDQGTFACAKSNLKALMDASKNTLPWADFSAVDDAREERNR